MKNKILKIIRDTKAGLFISICFSFMLMIYEPLNVFVTNRSDFDFDIYYFFPFVLLQGVICFILLYLLFIIFKLIHNNVYKTFVVIFLITLICSYIQGNYLVGNLPAIDGEEIDFSIFKSERIVSIILWLIISSLTIFTLVKYKFKCIEKISKYSSLLIMAMLAVSMLSFPASKDFFKHTSLYYANTNYINELSNDKNFIIFMLDSIDSVKFNKELEKLGKKEELLQDFTYFPDTMGGYPFTRNSIPLILSGKWFENKQDFSDFLSETLADAKVFNEFEKQGYLLDFYERDLTGYNGNNSERIRNMEELKKYDKIQLFKEEMKVVLYKYLPFQLKSISKVETFDLAKVREAYNKFDYDDVIAYNRIKNEDLEIVDDKIFHYIHLEGAHNPQRYDINLNIVENGTHEGNMDACITLIETFLNKLKENNVYDNSIIIIMSDHGYNKTAEDRQNPILYIKGFDEKHSYSISQKKVSYVNLADAFIELSNSKSASELFENVDNSIRRYFFYRVAKDYTMKEMEQTGFAWDTSTLVETGKVFERE